MAVPLLALFWPVSLIPDWSRLKSAFCKKKFFFIELNEIRMEVKEGQTEQIIERAI